MPTRSFSTGVSLLLLSVTVLVSGCAQTKVAGRSATAIPSGVPVVATFSIVAYDEETESWGIAVQSKVVAVGAVVPWAQAGHGAVATQAHANVAYGPDGLEMLAQGMSAQEVVDALVEADENRDHRQVGVVDARGRAAAFTGERCMDWAGHRVGAGYCVQGNILAGEGVVDAMARAYEAAEGDFGDRLIDALEAGQAAGGDRRGRQSASLYIVRAEAGYAGGNDRYRDVRVDDHETPIAELRRVYHLHRRMFRD
ncbi:DUF1028 domain-containing protein [Phycisphaeraceae bacterium D3-23]